MQFSDCELAKRGDPQRVDVIREVVLSSRRFYQVSGQQPVDPRSKIRVVTERRYKVSPHLSKRNISRRSRILPRRQVAKYPESREVRTTIRNSDLQQIGHSAQFFIIEETRWRH